MSTLASPRAMLDAIDSFPVLVAARDRLARCIGAGASTADLVPVIESDVALTIAVLRIANHGPHRGSVASVADGVRVTGRPRLGALAARVAVAEPLSVEPADQIRQHFRLHCAAVQATMDRLVVATGCPERDELLTAALLHDIGELVPGDDHAAGGAAVARRLGLPERLVQTIAEHDVADAGNAGMVRLADMLTLYAHGRLVDLEILVALGGGLGVSHEQLGRLMYDLPHPMTGSRRVPEPCPLSARELEVLERLAGGELYKQIGVALSLSTSTVRSHLHRIYTRIGVADRTQAVLLARECGWI